ncbi:MAG: hypothetical protein JXA94_06640 [Parachlamydiales bacterium]|nr:hypothetical protein [Parachlamydiales bacterium]
MKNNKPNKEDYRINKHLLWLLERRKGFFSIIAIITCLSIIAYRVAPLFNTNTVKQEYLLKNKYESLKETPLRDESKINEIKDLLKKNPHLKPKYEGLFLQTIVMNDQFSKDDSNIAKSAIARVKTELPLYGEFAEASILIAQKEYEKALEISKSLKNKMLNDLSFLKEEILPAGCVLYSFNLLRIACLYGKLENNKEEVVALDELMSYLKIGSKEKVNENIKRASDLMKKSFKRNNMEIADYIKYKKQLLE